MFSSRVGTDIGKLLLNGKEDFLAQAKAYDSMGNEVPLWEKSLERKLLVLRMQAFHIQSPWSNGES